MTRYRHSLPCLLLVLSGCQTFSGLFQDRFAAAPEYRTDEQLAVSQPLSQASSPELGAGVGNGVTNAVAVEQDANPVSLASYNPANTPQQAGRNSSQSLVEAGQQALPDAGVNDPSGLQQARALFHQALSLDSSNTDAHHGIAIVADLQKDWRAAEQHYKQALSGNVSNPNLLNDLGYSYLLQSRYHESLQYLNQAIQISPKHERAHLNLALLSLRQGDADSARQTLTQIYSPQEVESNLARLQQDLIKLIADAGGNYGTGAGSGAGSNSGNLNAGVAQAQPSPWNANDGQVQPYPGQPVQQVPRQQVPRQLVPRQLVPGQPVPGQLAGGGIQHFSDAAGSLAIDPALGASRSQPVSLYPPGVIREDVVAGQVANRNQALPERVHAGAANSQFGNAQHGNIQGGQSNFQAYPVGNSRTVHAAGANNSSAAIVQQPPAFGGVGPQGGSPAGLNLGPGMPFPVGGVAGQHVPSGQFNPGQFNSGVQETAQPLLNQYGAGGAARPATGFGQANYRQVHPGASAVGGSGYVPYVQGQQSFSQFPAHRQPQAGFSNQQHAARPVNTQPVSYGRPVGNSAGQVNPSQGQGLPYPAANQVPGTLGSGMNHGPFNHHDGLNQHGALNQHGGLNQHGAINGQQPVPFQPQPANFGQGVNAGVGNPGYQGGVPQYGVSQGGPMQQFEQQQMNRINDQYQQALQQMNGRGFSGQ